MMQYQRDPNQLEVYTEIRKSKILVGTLRYDKKTKKYLFDYDRKYLLSKSAIPLGAEFPLKKGHYVSKTEAMFPSFLDRIPSKENPAYEEYCLSQGVSPKEKNPIILLTTIGRRGSSTFVFEPIILEQERDAVERFKIFRKEIGLTLREAASAFDVALLTLNKIENGKSRDKNTIKLLQIYLTFPEVALWQIKTNKRKLHQNTLNKLRKYFKAKLSDKKEELVL